MQGIIQKGTDLRNATMPELRQTLQELLFELRFRFSTLSKDNFGEQDLRELATIILSDGEKCKVTIKDGTVTIEADEINLTGDVYINGSPV